MNLKELEDTAYKLLSRRDISYSDYENYQKMFRVVRNYSNEISKYGVINRNNPVMGYSKLQDLRDGRKLVVSMIEHELLMTTLKTS